MTEYIHWLEQRRKPEPVKVAGHRAVDRFRILDNVRHFRDQLCSETDPAHRARLQKQLVEEEDRLGANAALLDNLDREIDRAIILVARQTALVVAMERDGSDNVKQARTLLYCLIDGQNLHERYRQQVLAAIEENRLL